MVQVTFARAEAEEVGLESCCTTNDPAMTLQKQHDGMENFDGAACDEAIRARESEALARDKSLASYSS
jgi:hypothetical protein